MAYSSKYSRLSLHCLAVAIGVAFGTSVLAHTPPAARTADPRTQQQASALNGELLRGLRDLERAAPAARATQEQRLSQIASRRAAALKALAEEDPGAALLQTMPPELRDRLPASAAGAVEQEVDATGVVVGRIAENFETHQSRQDFFLDVQHQGKTRRLSIARGDLKLTDDEMVRLVGKRMKIRGMLLDDQLMVAEQRNVRVAANDSTTTSTSSSTPTISAVVTGDQSTLVIMGNFSDRANSCSSSTLANGLFSSTGSSMDGLFRETSRNNVSFSGKVIGPFNINFSAGGSCDYGAWGQALDAAATAAGHNLSGYKRISYSVPANSSCGWSGLAYVGGTRSWVNTCSAGVFAHELGHNLRFHHASANGSEYGDGSDPMGGARMVQFNAANRVMAGWQPTGTLQDVIGSSSFSLSSISLTTLALPQVLRVRKADSSEYYYLSVRSGSGYDLNLSGYKGTVTVHRSTGTMPSKTHLVAQLSAGQSFNDATNGITITPSTVDSTAGSATVAVSMTTAACAPSAPTISVSPVSQSGSPGQSRTYGVTVTNKDSGTCASSTFSLTQSLPVGFAGNSSPSSVTLAPGASTSANWTVTSPSTASEGSYALATSVSSTSGTARSASANAAYVVYSDTSAPVVSFTSPSYGASLRRGSITLTASATDSSGVARVDFYANGKLVGSKTSAPYTVKWNARRVAPGDYSLTARAADIAGNVGEATIPIKLQ